MFLSEPVATQSINFGAFMFIFIPIPDWKYYSVNIISKYFLHRSPDKLEYPLQVTQSSQTFI